MKKRKARPKSELESELRDQIALLKHACDGFDQGMEALGKHIALSLRVLLHHHGQSRSLLEQLGIRNSRFYDSAGPVRADNLLPEFNLIVLQMSGSGGRYIPQVQAGEPPRPPKKIEFPRWWNDPVLRDQKRRTFSRRELVQHVADTDGGAHVDPELDEAYIDISRANSLGWVFRSGDIEKAFEGRPELACMRQIAHEVLLTLRQKVPHLFG